MASGRSSLTLLCVCSLVLVLLVADVTAAGAVQQQQPATGVTGAVSTRQFYLRGNLPAGVAAEGAGDETFESFERRELMVDYGKTPARANCSRNCKKL